MHAAIVASLAALAVAAPVVEKRQALNDGLILNYALTLEHLEDTFYREALAKFSEEDFKKAGLPASFYNNLQEIASDEKTHVAFLTTALSGAGVTPVAECTYEFGLTDVPTFLAIANVLEGVGVSAYLGAAQFIANKAYLTAAGSILTVEARHSAYLRQYQTPALSPFPSPFDKPLDLNEVFTLAAPFIKSCPAGDADSTKLGLTGFPAISVAPTGIAQKGDKLTLTVASAVDAKAAYLINSGGPVKLEASGSGTTYEVIIPDNAEAGQSYIVLTKDENTPTDDNTAAGPAVFEIADNAFGRPADAAPCYGGGKPGSYKPEPEPYKPEPKPYKPEHKPEPKPYKPEHKPAPKPYKKHPKPEHKPEPKPYKPSTTTPCPSATPKPYGY